jgi:hypothetical protein
VGEREDRFGDGIWVVGGDQHAFASRLDQLFEAADARGHHRPARQHCLQAGRVSGLLPSWEHNDVHQTQERGRVVAVAREHGPGLKAQISGEPAQLGRRRAVSRQQQGEGG